MTRGEIFDAVFDAVYETMFAIIDEEPDGDAFDEEIDWGEDVTDRRISVDVKVTIEPPEKSRGHRVRKVKPKRAML